MELYVKKDKTGKKGTRVGLKVDKLSAAMIGKSAVLMFNKISRDQDLKDAASKYILKSVEYNTRAEETDDPEKKKEYQKKAKEYEDKAREISALINDRKKILNSKEVKECMEDVRNNINIAYEDGRIDDHEKIELMQYTIAENYHYEDEFIDSLIYD